MCLPFAPCPGEQEGGGGAVVEHSVGGLQAVPLSEGPQRADQIRDGGRAGAGSRAGGHPQGQEQLQTGPQTG